MELPEQFQQKMKKLLQHEYASFLQTYSDRNYTGLRINTLKVNVENFLSYCPFSLEQIPWVQTGFYYDENDRPGKHPYHEAGLYYIQEPSAMAVAEIVQARPGERVLDLCAAPGGKTTHLAAGMKQQGVLVANEIHPTRVKILSQNVERMGIMNAIVTNESPDRLAVRFPSYFDKILVDAPCSGEGMFRKHPQACEAWSTENVTLCASRQLDILQHAAKMLRSGGRLVYSTCTFSPEENEAVISQFVKDHPAFEIEQVEGFTSFDRGRPDWITAPADGLQRTFRLWPHRVKGEGHYIAVLRKTAETKTISMKHKIIETERGIPMPTPYKQFADEQLKKTPSGKFVLFSDQLYLLPEEMLSLSKLKVLRPGWHLGTLKKNRFVPSHALALALQSDQVKHIWNIKGDSSQIEAYLRGEALQAEGAKGWYLVLVDGFSIGWGKLAGGLLKNHYPKGLRWS